MGTKLVTGSSQYGLNTLVRFSFTDTVFAAKASEDGEKEKFGCMILVRKSDKATLALIEKSIKAETEAWKVSNNKKVLPSAFKTPLRDGAEKADTYGEYMSDYMFFNANSVSKPKVVGRDMQPITDNSFDEVPELSGLYSGCWGRVSIDFYHYNGKSAGVAVGLNNIQKLKEGEHLGAAKPTPESDFGEAFGGDLSDDDLLS